MQKGWFCYLISRLLIRFFNCPFFSAILSAQKFVFSLLSTASLIKQKKSLNGQFFEPKTKPAMGNKNCNHYSALCIFGLDRVVVF
jgi:hypothetical protein